MPSFDILDLEKIWFDLVKVVPETLDGKPFDDRAVLCARYSDEEFFRVRCKGFQVDRESDWVAREYFFGSEHVLIEQLHARDRRAQDGKGSSVAECLAKESQLFQELQEHLDISWKMFNAMTAQNKVSWNAMISGLTSNGLHFEAFDLFLRMKKEGIIPNMYTLISVSKAVGKLGDVDKSKIVHSFASELGMEPSVLVGTALIDMYSKCKSLSDARSVFDLNFTRCGVNPPWNAIISGYSQCGHSQEALELFVRMCVNNVEPDVYTYCSMFNAIATLKCLCLGKQIHGMVLKSGIEMKGASVSNSIADAYAKCGLLEDVQKIFDRIENTILRCLMGCSAVSRAIIPCYSLLLPSLEDLCSWLNP